MASKDEKSSAAAESSAILSITRDACRHLSINWAPDHVMWAQSYFSGEYAATAVRSPFPFRDVPSDHPAMFRDTLYVAPSMIGRLQPEEWRPIVASSMIYYAKLATRKDIGIIIRTAPFVILVGVWLYSLGLGFLDFTLLATIAYSALAVFVGLFLIKPYQRKLWLKSDRIAAEYVGYPIMIGVLEKVQGFRIAELEGGRFNNLPSLAERIARLKESSNA